MKEIGMEKLIELLDKFRRENKTKELFGEPGTLVPLTGKDFIELNRVMIISKEYEFIKWLVDNDKIDLDKLEEKAERKPQYTFIDDDGRLGFKLFEVYESLLMLLAIQDEPISFLISILK